MTAAPRRKKTQLSMRQYFRPIRLVIGAATRAPARLIVSARDRPINTLAITHQPAWRIETMFPLRSAKALSLSPLKPKSAAKDGSAIRPPPNPYSVRRVQTLE